MLKKLQININQFDLINYFVIFLLLLTSVTSALIGDNMIYGIGQINTYNPEFFINNIYLGENVSSVRVVTDKIIAFFMAIFNGEWPISVYLWLILGIIIQTIAIVRISSKVSIENKLTISLIFALLILFFNNNLAGFAPSGLASSCIGMALACAYMAISFIVGKEKNFNLAWVFVGVSMLCHIHEGIYSFIVVLIILISEIIVEKKYVVKRTIFIVFPILCSLLIVLPNFKTDVMNISNSEFVNIYSIIRHPHHLVPTYWGVKEIAKSFWVNVSLFVISFAIIYKNSKTESLKESIVAILLNLAWMFAIVIMFVYTERIPIAFISTMFVSKSFKYVVIVSMIYIIKSISYLIDNKSYSLLGIIILFLIIVSSIDIPILLALTFIIIFFCNNRDVILLNEALYEYLLYIILFGVFLTFNLQRMGKQSGLFFILLAGAIFCFGIRLKYFNKIRIALGIALFMLSLIVIFYNRLYFINSNHNFTFVNSESIMKKTMGDDLYNLSIQFKDKTSKDVTFVSDSDNDNLCGWFQINSLRNCFALEKVVPSNKKNMKEWFNRWQQTRDIFNRELNYITNLMRERDIDYILVPDKYFDKFSSSNNLSLFLKSPNNLYHVFKYNTNIVQ